MEYDIKTDYFETKRYYKKGTKILHREDGPAIEWGGCSEEWYFHGKRHRENGPAVKWVGSWGRIEWWVHGNRHRTDGPAVTWENGDKEWWVDGKMLPLEKQNTLDKWWDNKNGI